MDILLVEYARGDFFFNNESEKPFGIGSWRNFSGSNTLVT